MNPLRRLRAVAVLSLVSGIGWALAGAVIVSFWTVVQGGTPQLRNLLYGCGVFGFVGLLSGVGYALMLVLVPARDGAERYTLPRAAIFGFVSGLTVLAGLELTVMRGGPVLPVAAWFGGVGALVGAVIHRVASRGQIAAAEQPKLLT